MGDLLGVDAVQEIVDLVVDFHLLAALRDLRLFDISFLERLPLLRLGQQFRARFRHLLGPHSRSLSNPGWFLVLMQSRLAMAGDRQLLGREGRVELQAVGIARVGGRAFRIICSACCFFSALTLSWLRENVD